jgi:hypothetical protein
MTWFKVDDGLHSHPKARRAGLAALGLWAVAGSWSSDQLTDGFVPAWFVDTWPNGRRLAQSLVDARLWTPDTHDDEPGWRFHEWDERNPSSEQVKTKRRAAAERQARARAAARAADNGHVTSPAVSHAVTDPVSHEQTEGVGDAVSSSASHAPPDPYLSTRTKNRGETAAAALRSVTREKPPPPHDPPPETPAGRLALAVAEAGMPARFDKLSGAQSAQVNRLVDVHGVEALVRSAWLTHRPDRPAAFAQAWLPGWLALPPPGRRLHVVVAECPAHRLEEPCRSCAADSKAAGGAP